MRRSASEVIRDLEMRVARLERQSAPKYKMKEQKDLNDFIAFCTEHGLERAGDVAFTNDQMAFLGMMRNKFGAKGVKLTGNGEVSLTRFGEQVLNENT